MFQRGSRGGHRIHRWVFTRTRWSLFFATFALYLRVQFAASPSALTFLFIESDEQQPAQRTLALLLVISTLWATEALPPFVTALLVPPLVVVLRVLPVPEAYVEGAHADALMPVSGKQFWHTRKISLVQH